MNPQCIWLILRGRATISQFVLKPQPLNRLEMGNLYNLFTFNMAGHEFPSIPARVCSFLDTILMYFLLAEYTMLQALYIQFSVHSGNSCTAI